MSTETSLVLTIIRERAWRHADVKDGLLPHGPWQDEPDKIQWIDDATGLDCLIVRSYSGALCGYVGVPQGHPFYRIEYDACPQDCEERWCEHSPTDVLAVHGCVTFSDVCCETAPEGRGICHIPFDGRPADIWWIGFDCAHAWDFLPRVSFGHSFGDATYKDVAFVRRECARLAQQLARIGRVAMKRLPAGT